LKILILSFYYPPDLNPGSFRTEALVRALRQEYGTDIEITVVASTPNRYRTHKAEDFEAPDAADGPDRLIRLPIKVHKSGLFDQALAYRSFFFGAQRACRGEQFDLVYATSSRLMTGFTGARIARRMGAPLVLDIRDLFVDTMGDLLRGSILRLTLPVFRMIERYTFSAAKRVTTVSEAFVPYLCERGVSGPIEFFPNGIDSLFLNETDQAAKPSQNQQSSGAKRLVYVGNIGDGQGLDRILPEVAVAVNDSWEFHLVGFGGAIGKLKDRISELGVTNIVFHDPVPRKEVPSFYRDADALFLHLNAIPAFKRVIPSKIFEYGACEKPVIAGVAGYPAQFIASNLPDVLLFDPCDVQSLTKILEEPLPRISRNDRGDFVTRFRREAIMGRLAAWITADL
jgi:glycosyltransferase involved in cell wall biosynthesis